MKGLKPYLAKNDKRAHLAILSASALTFALVLIGSKVRLNISVGFNVHNLAAFNALINAAVSTLLMVGLIAVKQKRFVLHRNIMISAIVCSVIFLLSYVCYHFLSDSAKYGGTGYSRFIYYFILITHIVLAAVILPFILYTAYRALTGEYDKYKRLTRITFPIWLYVSITGVIVYLMISPYYN